MLSKKMRVSSVDRDRSFGRGVSSRVPKERKRFTPWLEEQIDEGGIDGLEWIEKDKGIFKVPWVRVDKPEFVLETHAELFKRWAQHTGKYRQGDQPDPSTWKTRFRCALRKMQEIVEIKELGSLEGSRPYRAFKFEPKLKERTSFKRSPGKGRRRSSLDSLESSDNSPMDPNSVMGGPGDAWEVVNVPNGRMNQLQFYDEYAPGLSYGLRGQETNNFDSLQNNWIASSCLMQEGFNGAIYNEHIPLHQLVDLRDFAEPVKPEDLDRYFPDGIWNQYSLSGGSNYGMREQESNYGPTILREGLFTVFN